MPVIGILTETKGGAVDAPKESPKPAPAKAEETPKESPAAKPAAAAQKADGPSERERIFVSPLAKRMAKRAKLPEEGVAVAFTFNNLLTMVVFGVVEDIAKLIPSIGDFLEMAISLVSFYWHRVVPLLTASAYSVPQ